MTKLEMTGRKRFGDITVHSCDEISPLVVRMLTEGATPLDDSEFVLVMEHVRTCTNCQKRFSDSDETKI